ncbi:MAG: DUF896 domain-containing protein [Clostridia bacterium]|nr:DUF896 domain-containing protein [Clostridia bacterium]
MQQRKMDRISELTRIARERDLTAEEQAERQALREEYIREFRSNMKQILDNTTVERPDGTVEPLRGIKH